MGDVALRQTCDLPNELAAKAHAYAKASLAQASLATYRKWWRLFAAWCDGHGHASLPAADATVALYLADIADRCRPNTINGYLAAIGHAHRAAGFAFNRAVFETVLHGICRTYGMPPRDLAPLTVGELRTIVLALPDTLSGIRDRALLAVGFAGALHARELVGLDIGPPAPGSRGSVEIDQSGARITVRRRHSDQAPIVKMLLRGGSPCPVQALEIWLVRAGISKGPIFPALTSHATLTKRRPRPYVVTSIIKRAIYQSSLQAGLSAPAAKLRASGYCGHSLRAGFVTSAIVAGASDESIARHVGWVTTERVAQYRRQRGVFKKHPVTQVLGS